MLGVVIPAHNEEALIGQALDAVLHAARHPALAGEAVDIVVVLDRCSDATGPVARSIGVRALAVNAGNVGAARAAGAELMLRKGVRWLAFTDADTLVSPSWLVEQLALNADAVCGCVTVNDWSAHGDQAAFLAQHFARTYFDVEGHRHIHGANLGVSAQAYQRAGGFAPLACSEDVALVRALEQSGARIAWSARPRVVTSARREARAQGGFADALLNAVAAATQLLPLPVPSVQAVSP